MNDIIRDLLIFILRQRCHFTYEGKCHLTTLTTFNKNFVTKQLEKNLFTLNKQPKK